MPFPRWIDTRDEVLLREVAPGLFVGGRLAVRKLQKKRPWAAVIDLYGSSGDVDNARFYEVEKRVPVLLRWPFYDGDTFPDGALDAISDVVRGTLHQGPVLIHCQAGLSRSASTAYALLRTLGGMDAKSALARVWVTSDFPRAPTLGSAEAWARRQRRRGVKPLTLLRVGT